MILQALTRYFDILSQNPSLGVSPEGYSTENISFALDLSELGKLKAVIPLFDILPSGRKTREVPRRMNVPAQVKRSVNINANFLCDMGAYVLALSNKESRDPEYAVKRFRAFKELNINILQTADCPAAKAVIAFLESYDPETGAQHPAIAPRLEGIYAGGNLVFRLEGSETFVHEDREVRRAWEAHLDGEAAGYEGQCLVTGEIAPIERLHPSISGVKDANSTGASLVSFNERSYESYNRTNAQGLNSPVSRRSVFAYTTALNYLLSRDNPNRKFTIGDTTVVYWAESPKQEYGAAFFSLIDPNYAAMIQADQQDEMKLDPEANQRLRSAAESVRRLAPVDASRMMEGLDPETRFYVLGLAPNAARLSVRFFHGDTFKQIIEKIMQHYNDLSIDREYGNQPEYIPLGRLILETVSQKAKNPEAAPLLAGAVMRAILMGTPYPDALFTAIITRIRSDVDDDAKRITKINYVRAAILKACLIRKYRNQKENPIQEVLCMSLNDKATQPAYLLGRLFAVLEKVQQEAIGKDIASIKDRYFTSACATPANVFPVLLRLSQHHISKAEYGKNSERRIEEIMDLLELDANPFPKRLSLDEQGVFVLGYYHQRKAFYLPKEKPEEPELATDANE